MSIYKEEKRHQYEKNRSGYNRLESRVQVTITIVVVYFYVIV